MLVRSSSWRVALLGVALGLPSSVRAQQPVAEGPRRSFSTPASGDTIGYWQQRADYRIVATLDEEAQRLRATGELTYVNASPDTLRELYVHQYLNAFRPGSGSRTTRARGAPASSISPIPTTATSASRRRRSSTASP